MSEKKKSKVSRHVVPDIELSPGALKDTNPKDAIGCDKLPFHLWPETATASGCLGLLDGALKYGRANWRASGVRMSIYVDALRRHVNALFEGEDLDPDSGLPHEAHALACLAIIVDARAAGMLTDDRQYKGGYRKLVEEMTPHVARLKAKHAGKNPKHWTIAGVLPAAPPAIDVVVGVIVDKLGRVFLQRRPLDDENFPGAWECPGGGVERGETDLEALRRELREELGIEACIRQGVSVWCGEISGYKGRQHSFRFYLVSSWTGTPKAIDGQPAVGWFTPAQAISRSLALTPANMLAWPTLASLLKGGRRWNA